MNIQNRADYGLFSPYVSPTLSHLLLYSSMTCNVGLHLQDHAPPQNSCKIYAISSNRIIDHVLSFTVELRPSLMYPLYSNGRHTICANVSFHIFPCDERQRPELVPRLQKRQKAFLKKRTKSTEAYENNGSNDALHCAEDEHTVSEDPVRLPFELDRYVFAGEVACVVLLHLNGSLKPDHKYSRRCNDAHS